VAVGNAILEIRGLLLEHWLWMTGTACTGSAMALLVSALVRSERAALTSVPLLLVPQMLLAGALVPFSEMNRALFHDAEINRERGGVPVPAAIMPLRYSYEAMVVTQATRNPFDFQRRRIQHRIDLVREHKGRLKPRAAERLEILKLALTRLLAAGASDPADARLLLARIGFLARAGTKAEIETLEVWPDNDPEARPCSEFFVNNRIDLMIREAESYRNDYRNTSPRNVFLAEKKFLYMEKTGESGERKEKWISTPKYNAAILASITLLCLVLASLTIRIQNSSTRG
jgi:hypothetical protein